MEENETEEKQPWKALEETIKALTRMKARIEVLENIQSKTLSKATEAFAKLEERVTNLETIVEESTKKGVANIQEFLEQATAETEEENEKEATG